MSPHVTGFVERLVFTAVVFAQPEVAVLGMGGWLALKMAAAWNKDIPTLAPDTDRAAQRKERMDWNSHGFLGLVSGFMGMAFAGLGGGLARYLLNLPVIANWPPTP